MRQLVPIYVALNAAAFITHHDRQRPAQKWRWHVFRYIELRPLGWQVIIWEPPIVERVYNGVFFFRCTMLFQRMSQQLNKDGQKMLARDSNVLQTEKYSLPRSRPSDGRWAFPNTRSCFQTAKYPLSQFATARIQQQTRAKS